VPVDHDAVPDAAVETLAVSYTSYRLFLSNQSKSALGWVSPESAWGSLSLAAVKVLQAEGNGALSSVSITQSVLGDAVLLRLHSATSLRRRGRHTHAIL
jgi:hypothetical protein